MRPRHDDVPAAARRLDILIIGPVPPPLGGIAVHLQRLVPRLQRGGLDVGVLNHFGSRQLPFVVGALNRNPFNYYRVPRRFDAHVVHYHHSRWVHLVAFALGARGQEVRRMMTLHAGDIDMHFPQLVSRNPLVRRLTLWSLRQFDTIVVVDPTIGAILREHVDGPRIEVLPAFIEADDEPVAYEDELEEFLDGGRVLVVAAYRVSFVADGGELYGLDTAVEAFNALAAGRPELRLAMFVAQAPPGRGKARRHLERLEGAVADAGLSDRVRIAYNLPLTPAFRGNSIFLRPTRAEGDALSVREAQRAGVPVVASDVVPRPAGVVTFPTGNATALQAAVTSVLEVPGGTASRERSQRDTGADAVFVESLTQLYKDELQRGRGVRCRRG